MSDWFVWCLHMTLGTCAIILQPPFKPKCFFMSDQWALGNKSCFVSTLNPSNYYASLSCFLCQLHWLPEGFVILCTWLTTSSPVLVCCLFVTFFFKISFCGNYTFKKKEVVKAGDLNIKIQSDQADQQDSAWGTLLCSWTSDLEPLVLLNTSVSEEYLKCNELNVCSAVREKCLMF